MMSKSLESDFKEDIDNVNLIIEVNSILEVVCKMTGMGFAAIARVTKDRWINCASRDEINFGLQPGDELELETTICHEIEISRQAVIISNVSSDPIYSRHHTPAKYGFQSYISIPIVLKKGAFFGTLCAIHPHPVDLNRPEIYTMFKLYADMIAFHLNTAEELSISRQSLLEEKETAELRDQFIAVLGHDLRNPIGAIRNSAQLLQRGTLNEREQKLVNIITDSSYRITGLIDNILDFARGRLGGGITLDLSGIDSMESSLIQVITELQTVWADRIIDSQFLFLEEVNCDNKRIAQLFSNILGNALSYGDVNIPVTVSGVSDKDKFMLSVSNAGEKIPDYKLQKLFQPFHRGMSNNNKDGLGLGLYISSEIAKAHGGTLTVTSDDKETCFSLIIPSVKAIK